MVGFSAWTAWRVGIGTRARYYRYVATRDTIIMNMLLRLLWVSLRARFGKRCEPLGPCTTYFTVLPTDLDVFWHMNNGVYLSIMDLGRVDLLIRSGMMKLMRRAGYWPIIAAETIRFKRPLKLWQRFALETRVIGWDDKAFLMEQRFLRRKEGTGTWAVIAEGIVRARFLSAAGTVPASDYLALLGEADTPSPVLPEWIAQWNAVQSSLRDTTGANAALDAV
jgi:acyl-CoA thioesterase FadM